MKEIKSIFKNHNASVTEVHVTSDGQFFFLKHHAISHANGLEDKRVQTVTREEAEAFPDDEETITEEAAAEEKAAADKAAEEKAAEEKAAAEKAAEEKAAADKAAEEKAAADKAAEDKAAADKASKKK